jgi:hypothetical protein
VFVTTDSWEVEAEDHEFEVSLGSIVRSCLKKEKVY